jgi:hypothetical protein
VSMQEVCLADGTVYKVFSKCAVKIFVERGANHRDRLRMQLVDRGTLGKAELVKGS